MKIAVYTIAKNERQHLDKWFASCWEADAHILCDTGSDDDTIEVAEKLGIAVVKFEGDFSFDKAKNFALDAVPDDIDICINLDCDETLAEGWRQLLESRGAQNTAVCLVSVINLTDEDALTVGRIHPRHGCVWENPIHEYVRHESGTVVSMPEFVIYHNQDKKKPRDYVPKLLEEIGKDPDNWKLMYNLAMDFAVEHNDSTSAVYWFRKVLEYSEKQDLDFVCYVHRLLGEFDSGSAPFWLHSACEMGPMIRENWFELSRYYFQKNWEWCLYAARKSINIAKPTKLYIDALAWSAEPYLLAGISAYELEDYEESKRFLTLGLDLEPDSERIKEYLERLQREQVPTDK